MAQEYFIDKEVLKQRARKMRNHSTDEEVILWSRLQPLGRAYGIRFRRQHRIGKYIVDFYSRQTRIVIEVDGEQHADQKQLLYDQRRTAFLKQKGLLVVRFWNSEVKYELENVMECIAEYIHLQTNSSSHVQHSLDLRFSSLKRGEK